MGFALTILQRRLASSPEAIYQSLRRRRERLESRLREEVLRRGATARFGPDGWGPTITEEDLEDLEDATDDEVDKTEEEIMDLATASQTIAELQAEIQTLKDLEVLALQVRRVVETKNGKNSQTDSRTSKKCSIPRIPPKTGNLYRA